MTQISQVCLKLQLPSILSLSNKSQVIYKLHIKMNKICNAILIGIQVFESIFSLNILIILYYPLLPSFHILCYGSFIIWYSLIHLCFQDNIFMHICLYVCNIYIWNNCYKLLNFCAFIDFLIFFCIVWNFFEKNRQKRNMNIQLY